MTLPLRHPFTMLIAGPTGCGKTRFTFKLVENTSLVIEPSPRRIVYCYAEYQQLFARYPRVEFRRGLPNIDDFDGNEALLLIIDDLMQETDESIASLFTKDSHHRNISVVFLVQNMFHKKQTRGRAVVERFPAGARGPAVLRLCLQSGIASRRLGGSSGRWCRRTAGSARAELWGVGRVPAGTGESLPAAAELLPATVSLRSDQNKQ